MLITARLAVIWQRIYNQLCEMWAMFLLCTLGFDIYMKDGWATPIYVYPRFWWYKWQQVRPLDVNWLKLKYGLDGIVWIDGYMYVPRWHPALKRLPGCPSSSG